uniref:Uncharacterized protein n=1 Tax=Coccolithus braarudii TaxID=221442 RepID=A0A7S0Q1C8_9EUKA|eukprot:CAMPEP_0183362582 /NCGR_PEP_ID=MMETSP0164_2-20130417/70224_1 /TAXON_ID=221442 /ORGANISM="Coccolithus pelagicus ssp braarudi, Strain PLY182g" /LENGTH=113 /DNA_ID=CAMNT_0025537477 /DNA_START=354 /DNA_END=695 /DNA_ORIENTATION=+
MRSQECTSLNGIARTRHSWRREHQAASASGATAVVRECTPSVNVIMGLQQIEWQPPHAASRPVHPLRERQLVCATHHPLELVKLDLGRVALHKALALRTVRRLQLPLALALAA